MIRALKLAVSMFSVLPVPRSAGGSGAGGASGPPVDAKQAGRALLWLPVVGLVLGALAVLPALAVWRGGPGGSPLLAAVLAVTALGLLTRGLHLDGLADLADGLGSRRPAAGALEVMAQSDIGPFGVAAVVSVLLIEVAALSSILATGSRPAGIVALLAAVVVGRVAAIWAAGRSVPAARPDGFGALVAGSASPSAQLIVTVVALGAACGGAAAAGLGAAGLARLGASGLAALLVTTLGRRHAVTRLGGMTGDVFGALIELTTMATLVLYAGTLVWR
jgi:adenosylcobinamide-GDP ribazoletransferase